MRQARRTLSLVTALSTGLLVPILLIACGDGGKTGGESKTPASDTAPTSGPDPATQAAGDTSRGAGTTPTTTTDLPPSGELQGAKLGSSSRQEIETKGESGPKTPTGGASAGEPGRTAKDIQAVIASRRDDARACYDKALASHPGIEGDLDIKFKIDPEGNVFDAEVDASKSQILEPTVAQCIIGIIKKIKFAPSAKGYESRAHYPFNFHPRQGGAKRDAGAPAR